MSVPVHCVHHVHVHVLVHIILCCADSCVRLPLQGASVMSWDSNGHTPLLWAAACGKVGMVKQLIGLIDGGSPKGGGEEEEEEGVEEGVLLPLHAAASVGAVEACQVLMEGGAEVRPSPGVHAKEV